MSRHREAFEEFVDKVESEIGEELDRIVLFGSVARGDQTEESDVDVLVVVEDKGLKQRIFDISYGIMLEKDIYISPKVVDREEFEQIKDSFFMKEIEEEMQVYGAA